MNPWLLILLLALLAGALFIWAEQQKRRTGLPQGKVIYADSDQWQAVTEPLYDLQLKLTGKPDYILRLREGVLVPVEVKSTPAPTQPYANHIMQLAAYCLLLERTSGQRPPYGLLRYRNQTFQVDYTPELEQTLLALVEEIREVERQGVAPARSHIETNRCRGCGYREICEQRL
jgi:CRISPR-associated exonuclease Cas4